MKYDFKKLITWDTAYLIGLPLMAVDIFTPGIPRIWRILLSGTAFILFIVFILVERRMRDKRRYDYPMCLYMDAYMTVLLFSAISTTLFYISSSFMEPLPVMVYFYWFFVGWAYAARMMLWWLERSHKRQKKVSD